MALDFTGKGVRVDMEDIKALVHRYYETFFVKKDFSIADKLIAENYLLHDPAIADFDGGREVYKKFQFQWLEAFPDHRLTLNDQIAEGDQVVTRWTATGTHKNDLLGIPATQKKFTITGISISRVAGGQIVEEWQNWDYLGLLQQLGVVRFPK